jgi:hypothetical protein
MKRISNVKIIIITLIISVILISLWFRNIAPYQFLFIHDEYLSLTLQESFNSLFVHSSANFGSSTSVEMVVTFFDRIFYLLAYSLNNSIYFAQIPLYILKVTLIIAVPFFGFKKLAELYNAKIDTVIVLAISLWYSFNTFTLIYWNTQAFSLTVLLCYSLAPLTLYFYHKSIFEKTSIYTKIVVVMLLFLMSFAFYLFAVFIFLLFFYTFLYLFIFKVNICLFLKNVLLLVLIYLPSLAVAIIIPYDILTTSVHAANFTGNEAYGNLSGGILYQLLMWYSWPIYINWEPRNIFSFYNYFKSPLSIIAPFILYGLVIIGLIRNKLNKYSTIFLSLFLLFLLFIKGAQEPFGGIYLFLIKHFYFFNVFRSPDSKFGFGLVFVMSILLIHVAVHYRKKTIMLLLLLVIIIQGLPLFSGVAIRGENTAWSSDRIISITQGYREAVDFLNKNSNPYGYILPFPPDSFAFYKLDDYETHLGQDLLPKLSVNPFSYLSQGVGINSLTYNKLLKIVNSNNLADLKNFPIRYFVVRNDIISKKQDNTFNKKLLLVSQQVFKNKLFTIYEYINGVPIIQSENVQFKINNPVSYDLTFRNIKQDQKLFFNQSFNANWKLYPQSKNIPSYINEIRYLWQKPLFDTSHKLYNGYANTWLISSQDIRRSMDPKKYKVNSDGSIDFSLVLYYKPQSVFYNGAIVSFSYFFILLVVLLYSNLVTRRKKKPSKA